MNVARLLKSLIPETSLSKIGCSQTEAILDNGRRISLRRLEQDVFQAVVDDPGFEQTMLAGPNSIVYKILLQRCPRPIADNFMITKATKQLLSSGSMASRSAGEPLDLSIALKVIKEGLSKINS